MPDQLTGTGRFATAHASRYLQQLCKHFAHKVEVSYDAQEGHAAFPTGPATLSATPDELVVRVTAEDAEGLERARRIVDSHLERFAFREEFKQMDWS